VFILLRNKKYTMITLDPQTTPTPNFHQFMIGAIAPRPIALVSTVDAEGNPNLAPYSFFNAFSSKPPIIAFSTNRRVRDNSTKDTLSNIEETMSCVINVVSHSIARQASLASVNFPKNVSEFVKAGLTPIASEMVKAFRVKESPVQMECVVEQIVRLGTEGGAGNIVICRIVRMHINEQVMDAEMKRIDPHKIDLVGRMGRSYYARASGDAVYEIPQPELPLVIGFDGLPKSILTSEVLTGNSIAQIAGLTALPSKEDILSIKQDISVQKALILNKILRGLHLLAQEELKKGNTLMGAKLALLSEYL
jgi:flavin reductase (DIM6/NTAB) family NADH-FMN oxidoreductase RutF